MRGFYLLGVKVCGHETRADSSDIDGAPFSRSSGIFHRLYDFASFDTSSRRELTTVSVFIYLFLRKRTIGDSPLPGGGGFFPLMESLL